MRKVIAGLVLFLIFFACTNKKKSSLSQETTPLFKIIDGNQTGLDFSNDLELTTEFNIFVYMYFYNGGGLGVGDFNSDGLPDAYFAGNLVEDQLYLNNGNLNFRNITEESGIEPNRGWSTGVSVVDINSDGKLDIYVGQVGDFEALRGHNRLYVNQGNDQNGIPQFTEESGEYGLDLVGFSTHAAFLDYDLDGDLDFYQMNHSLHNNGTFGERKRFMGTTHPTSGDKFFKNENGTFVDFTEEAGINSTVIGYGLGLAVDDLNLDGYPDIYVGNDFHENDYLYINQKDGTFKEELTQRMMHTSRFSMGVDIADINNDLYPEVISLDMLPYDPQILKSSEGEDANDIFNFKLKYGYNHQYAKNALQLNNGDGNFTDIAAFSGVEATDWSWASLFVDFDNDGLKDLFVSNGIPKRMNDIDYINFVYNEDLSWKIKTNGLSDNDLDLLNKIPEIKLPNQLFVNRGDLQFSNAETEILNNLDGYSNGAAFADFDGDGDVDILTNNINEQPFLYENLTQSADKSIQISLKGSSQNPNAVGTRVLIYSKDDIIYQSKSPYKGYQSSMEGDMIIGKGHRKIDSVLIIWPDNSFKSLTNIENKIEAAYKEGLPKLDFSRFAVQSETQFTDVTEKSDISYHHKENDFVEFNREPLIPHETSSEGPALAVGDVNGDGLEDIFIGAAKRETPIVYFQTQQGTFRESNQSDLYKDNKYEDVDAHFVDVDNDNDLDLVVASGGNEYYYDDPAIESRVYLNDGKGQFTRNPYALSGIFTTAQRLIPYDFTGDGFVDLFLGSRAVSWAYGETPTSYLLVNDGKGNFKDESAKYNKEIKKIGMVKDAVWQDMDKDGDKDLIVCIEWGHIYAFENNGNHFTKHKLTNKLGWWNLTLPVDIDNDDDLDIIAGNLGLNSRLSASKDEPVEMYYYDFDGNGKKEQILTYFIDGKKTVFANKMEIQKQLPKLKKEYLYAKDFANASLQDLFGKSSLRAAQHYKADFFENALLKNEGNWNFTTEVLPMSLQHTPYFAGTSLDWNHDQFSDLLLFGNYYGCNVQMGRYDGDYGKLVLSHGGNFEVSNLPGLAIKGQVKKVLPIAINNQRHFIIARNDEAPVLMKIDGKN